jgi:hypothetical protein
VIPACRADANARFRFNGAGQAIRFCPQSRTGISNTVLFIGQPVQFDLDCEPALRIQTSVKPGLGSGDDRNLKARFCAQM